LNELKLAKFLKRSYQNANVSLAV